MRFRTPEEDTSEGNEDGGDDLDTQMRLSHEIIVLDYGDEQNSVNIDIAGTVYWVDVSLTDGYDDGTTASIDDDMISSATLYSISQSSDDAFGPK